MKKVFFSWMAVLLAVVLCVSVTSCKDDDEEGNALVGFWGKDDYRSMWTSEIQGAIRRGFSEPYEIDHDVWNFVNGNTVQHIYGHAYSSTRSDAFAILIVNGLTYYIVPKLSYTSTYQMNGDKVYCTNGEIFTMMNGKLYKDNSSDSYVKLK